MNIRPNRRQVLGTAMAAAGSLASLSSAKATIPPSELSALGFPPVGIAKLSENENPVGPSPAAKQAICDSANYGAYYVGKNVQSLKSMISDFHGLTPDHIAIGSGSSPVLMQLAAAGSKAGHILCPELFWDTTCRAAERQGAVLKRVPMTPDLAIDLDEMLARMTDETAIVHIVNPNNPTGLLLDPEKLRQFCRQASKQAIVVVDEAYNEITNEPDQNSMVDLVRSGHRVAVAHTFSKIYGLAGMRIGYMISIPEIINELYRFGLGDYILNQAGIAAALASFQDAAFIHRSRQEIIEARELVWAGLQANGLTYVPSQTNFVYVNLGSLNANRFRDEMKARGVLIHGIYKDYTHYSRVSMGKIEDVKKYVNNLPAVLEAMRS